jgi:translation initiation factor IF-2
MSTDADHEVIDSPEALFRHLYEAHQVEEALDLDPASAPVQFWLRRHAELERARRETGRRPAEPGPRPPAAGRDGRRPAGFGDPLVEAVARALAGRGHDEAAVRGAIRGYASLAGGRTGEAAVRGDFVEPMLRAAAERLLGAGEGAGPPAPAGRAPAAPPQANRPESERPEAGRPEGSGEPRGGAPVGRPEGCGEPRGGPPVDRSEGSREPRGGAPVRPEAAWAGLWADLGEGGAARRAAAGRPAGADDDLMAIADAVQRRRGRRLAEREPRPLRR